MLPLVESLWAPCEVWKWPAILYLQVCTINLLFYVYNDLIYLKEHVALQSLDVVQIILIVLCGLLFFTWRSACFNKYRKLSLQHGAKIMISIGTTCSCIHCVLFHVWSSWSNHPIGCWQLPTSATMMNLVMGSASFLLVSSTVDYHSKT